MPMFGVFFHSHAPEENSVSIVNPINYNAGIQKIHEVLSYPTSQNHILMGSY